MEGDGISDGLRPEDSCIFLFIDKPDSSHPDVVIVEIEFLGIVNRMTDLDAVPDVGGRHLIDAAFEAYRSVVIYYTLAAYQEDLIKLAF